MSLYARNSNMITSNTNADSAVEVDKLIENLCIGQREVRHIREDTFVMPKNLSHIYQKSDQHAVEEVAMEVTIHHGAEDKKLGLSRNIPKSKSYRKRARRKALKDGIAKKTLKIKKCQLKNNDLKRKDKMIRRKTRKDKLTRGQEKKKLRKDMRTMKHMLGSFKL